MQTTIRIPSRRTFLKGSLLGAAGLIVPHTTRARPIGANDEIRLGFIGIGENGGGRGSNHLKEFPKRGGCRVAAVCDADTVVIDKVKSKLGSENIQYYQDYRKLLENPDIDAVVIATPNHTHTVLAIQAMAAGKHVYVEKPVSHNLWEGRMLAKHAAKHPNLIVQHGMQRRSDEGWLQVKEFLKSGQIGKPLVSRGFCYKKRQSIGKGASGPAPSTVDYDLWSGPREKEEVKRKRFHYDWHWQWQWGNGDIGNQGPHQLDVARWLIDDPAELPAQILSIGGRFGYDDDATTANTQIAFFDYKPVPVIFEVRGLPLAGMDFQRESFYETLRKAPIRVGNVVECEGGWIAEGQAFDKDMKKIASFNKDDGANHQATFLKNLRDGKIAATHTVETGHQAAALAHLANTSYRLGKATPHGEIAEKLKSDAHASDAYGRMMEHLKANTVDLDKAQVVLGAALTLNPKTEQFEGNMADEANAISRGTYRDGWKIADA